MIFSYESAGSAVQEYDGGWFKSRLWSDDVKRDAAQAFLAAAAPYVGIDTSIWKKIAEEK